MGGRRTIEVCLHPDGSITGETKGMKGTTCLSALELLEALLDAKVADSAFTSEFYEQQAEAGDALVEELNVYDG